MRKEIELNIKRCISTIEKINNNFFFYKDVLIINDRAKTRYGVTTEKNINDVKELIPINPYIQTPYTDKGVIYMITKDMLNSVIIGKIHISEIELNDIVYPLPDNYILAIFDMQSNLIMDLDFNLIPLPIMLNDANGINNKNYNLDKLLNKLKLNNNVLYKDSLKIKDAPYYNRFDDCTKYIEFLYLPTIEEYKKIINLFYLEKTNYIMNNCIMAYDCRKEVI